MLLLDRHIKEELLSAGAIAVGYARAQEVPERVWQTYQQWLDDKRNGELNYMHNHPELRRDPRGLLDNAQTVISVAWPYLPPVLREEGLPIIARYAYSPDYHKSIRKILKPILRRWEGAYGITSRVCVDSAPMLERFWAQHSGIGFIGWNGCLIVPGYGSWVFLTEILIDKALQPDTPSNGHCGQCGACLNACPTGALGADGHVDCRKCLSALTIETPGKIPPGQIYPPTIAGCDKCQLVCPHNIHARPTEIPQFATIPDILTLTAEELDSMNEESFRRRFAGTALLRPGLAGLRANIACTSPDR